MNTQRTVCVHLRNGRYGHTTSGPTLFAAVANTIRWWEEECKAFGTALQIGNDEVFDVSVVGSEKKYRVRAGDVRKWLASLR